MVDQIRVVSFTTPAATGTLDITDPGITEPFSAAILIFSGTITDSSDVAHAVMGMGFVAPDAGATSEEQSATAHAQNGQNTTPNTGTRQSTAACITVGDPTTNDATTATIVAAYQASIAGGVRLDFTTVAAGPIQTKGIAILFAGLTRAYADSGSSSTVSAHESVGGTTDFEPDLVISLGSNGTLNTNNENAHTALGFALNKAGLPQVSAYVDADDGLEPTDSDGNLLSANFSARLSALRVEGRATVESFDATGLNHIANTAGTNWHYLALKFSGAFRMACAHLSAAASATRQDFNSFGFTPDLVLGMATQLTAQDSATDGALAASAGYFVTGRYGSRAYTVHHEEGITLADATVANAHTRQEDVAVLLYDELGTIVQRATWAGGTGSGGFALDFSTASAAGTLTALGIQLIPNPPLGPRRARQVRRARARYRRRPVLLAGRPPGIQPLMRLLKAWTRMRRAAQARLRWRPRLPFVPTATPLVGLEAEESKGRISGPGMIRATIAGPGVQQDELT